MFHFFLHLLREYLGGIVSHPVSRASLSWPLLEPLRVHHTRLKAQRTDLGRLAMLNLAYPDLHFLRKVA